MKGVNWRNVWKCTRKIKKEYLSDWMGWNNGKAPATLSREQKKETIRKVTYGSRLECMRQMLTDQCCTNKVNNDI